jgi:hypothetical protein
VPHEFHSELEFARSKAVRDFLREQYKRAWPDGQVNWNDRDNRAQRVGTDCTILLPGNRFLRCEEKVRRKHYTDIALEYISNDRKGTPGWALVDGEHDFTVYALPDAGRCYILPWAALHKVAKEKIPLWVDWAKRGIGRFTIVPGETKSPGGVVLYRSFSVGVPKDVLLQAVANAFEVSSTPTTAPPIVFKPLATTRDSGPQLSLDLGGGRRR